MPVTFTKKRHARFLKPIQGSSAKQMLHLMLLYLEISILSFTFLQKNIHESQRMMSLKNKKNYAFPGTTESKNPM